MLESLISLTKTLPIWLLHVVEVLMVAVLFSFCVIFMWGVVMGIKIVAGRANRIEEITAFPPTIKFKVEDK
jgi:hypothetical protein